VERLGEALADLYGDGSPSDGSPSDGELAPLRSALEEWRVVAGSCDLLLEPAVVVAVLEERLTRESGRFGHRSGALTISALEPMRAIPHRVLILMGLDAGVFPRQRQRPGFHLMESGRQLGDPDPADQDRYALLEALLSARDHLLISWNGLDERTGVARPPAVPVQHWMEWLAGELPAGQAAALQVWHDPNPLDPVHFLPRGDRPPSSCDRRQLEACRQLHQGLPPPEPGLAGRCAGPEAGPAPAGEPVEGDPFEDLRSWLVAPQKAWLRTLGLFPGERAEEVEDLEPLELGERERVALLREALSEGRPAGAESDLWLRRHRGEGRFPPARGAVLEADRLEERWRSLLLALEPLGEERTPLLRWERWQGSVSLRGDAVVLAHPARARVEHRLELWLRLQLAVAALDAAAPRRGVLIARGSGDNRDTFTCQLAFRAPGPEAARQELARLWELRESWRRACWPVPPETGWTWMAQGIEKATEAWEGTAFQGGGERDQEVMRVCFGHGRSLASLLEDLPFAEQAAALLPPLLSAILPPEKGRR
jgi:exodeoxyribonuclease V gamma subunit